MFSDSIHLNSVRGYLTELVAALSANQNTSPGLLFSSEKCDRLGEWTYEAGLTLEQGRPPSGSSRIFASISAFPSPAATNAHLKAWFKTG